MKLIYIIAIIVCGLIYFMKARDDGAISKAGPNELEEAIRPWGVLAPVGNVYIATQQDSAVAMMAESPDQLTAYREAISHEWKLLAEHEIIKSEDFLVKGADMKTEYCKWPRPDGKFNVICLGYNLLIVFMVVEDPVVGTVN